MRDCGRKGQVCPGTAPRVKKPSQDPFSSLQVDHPVLHTCRAHLGLLGPLGLQAPSVALARTSSTTSQSTCRVSARRPPWEGDLGRRRRGVWVVIYVAGPRLPPMKSCLQVRELANIPIHKYAASSSYLEIYIHILHTCTEMNIHICTRTHIFTSA